MIRSPLNVTFYTFYSFYSFSTFSASRSINQFDKQETVTLTHFVPATEYIYKLILCGHFCTDFCIVTKKKIKERERKREKREKKTRIFVARDGNLIFILNYFTI